MARRAQSIAVVLLVLAACASPPTIPDAGAPALGRFDALCRFLPAGMQSYWFSDWRPEALELDRKRRRIARAACDFQPPPGIPGIGTETSVEVYDYGIGPHDHPAKDHGNDWIPEPAIDHEAVWRTRPEPDRQPVWIAFVDGRYQVNTTSRALLVRALKQGETRQSILSFVPDASVLNADATEVVVCRPRPQPTTHFGGPAPTSFMMLQVHADGKRVEFFSTGLQQVIRDYYSDRKQPHLGKAVQRDAFFVFDMTFPERDSWMLDLMMLYGQQLAI